MVVTDYSESYEKLFGDALLYYRDETDFVKKLKEAEENSDGIRQRVKALLQNMQEEYSFAACAKILSDNLENGDE